jgi:hypothetical protein
MSIRAILKVKPVNLFAGSPTEPGSTVVSTFISMLDSPSACRRNCSSSQSSTRKFRGDGVDIFQKKRPRMPCLAEPVLVKFIESNRAPQAFV